MPFGLIPSKPTLGELVGLLNKLKPIDKPAKFRLFVHPSLLKLGLEGAKQVGIPSNCVYILGDRSPDRKHLDVGSLIKNVRRRKLPQQPVVPATKDTLAYLMFSSGTSGIPKGESSQDGDVETRADDHEYSRHGVSWKYLILAYPRCCQISSRRKFSAGKQIILSLLSLKSTDILYFQ